LTRQQCFDDAGRQSGKLDLSGLELTDIPLEVTMWAPFVAEPAEPEVAREEGAEEVLAVEKKEVVAAGGDGGGVAGEVAGGEVAGDAAGEEEDDSAAREAAYAVDDTAGRDEQKEERVEAMRAAPDMLAGEHAPADAERYENMDDDDRSFEHEEDIPAAQELRYGSRQVDQDEEGEEEVEEEESLASSDEEDLGVILDDEEEAVELPPEDAISGYKALVALDLRDNSIATVRDEFGNMQSLCSLHLCRNDIRVLPAALALLKNLKHLVATYNQINELPADFGESLSDIPRHLRSGVRQHVT